MAAQDAYNPGQEAASITAAPNLQTVQAQYDPNGSANKLIQALGAESTQRSLAEFQQVYQQKKQNDQLLKIDHYTQAFENDHVSGAVSQAQVKARFPEMVPVIAARVAESLGKKQGALKIASVIEEINGNDSLRLDTTQRAAYIAKKREEMSREIPEGNDFYSSGMVSAMDSAFGQQELKWQGQTAAYHQEVQKEALGGEVVTALNSSDPKAMLSMIDDSYGRSSSLSNIERNKVYVEATIKHAAVSDDPSILEKIPQRYLNVDSKAQIFQAGIAIKNQQWAQFSRAKEFEAYKRNEDDRNAKMDILRRVANNEPVNPAQYLKSPEQHAFATQVLEMPTLPEAASKSAAGAFRTSILGAGNVASLGSQADIAKAIFSLRGKMNPKDMAALVDEIPKLMEGAVLMNDPGIRRAFSDNIGFRLDDLNKSINPRIQLMLGTTNIRGNATAMFESEVRGNAEAAWKTNGQWPTGIEMRQITEAAVAKTSAYLDFQTSLKALDAANPQAPTAPSGKAKATPKAAPTAAPAGLPKGVTFLSN